MTFKERFKKMLTDTFTSRKFVLGLPIILILIWCGKVPGEAGLFAICALFAINSFDKRGRIKHNEPV